MFIPKRRSGAFTLVELLVVIGIIAALIGILLPVLSGVSARGRDIKCQSNLRQIVQAMMGYAAENKGSLPYGFYYNNSNNQHPDPAHASNDWMAAPGNSGFISWASQVGKYTTRHAAGLNDLASFPPVLQCPELGNSMNHYIGYVANMVVSVHPRDEIRIGGRYPRGQIKPSKLTLMLKDGTALLWDTAMEPGWYDQRIIGYLTGGDIDGQRFWNGAHTPQQRYYQAKDLYGQFPGFLGQNFPVNLNVGSTIYKNIDPPDNSSFPFQGNLRFRHNKEKACNAGFSDGSVRQFTAKVESNKTVKSRGHDALRKYFMTKWPPGVPVGPGPS